MTYCNIVALLAEQSMAWRFAFFLLLLHLEKEFRFILGSARSGLCWVRKLIEIYSESKSAASMLSLMFEHFIAIFYAGFAVETFRCVPRITDGIELEIKKKLMNELSRAESTWGDVKIKTPTRNSARSKVSTQVQTHLLFSDRGKLSFSSTTSSNVHRLVIIASGWGRGTGSSAKSICNYLHKDHLRFCSAPRLIYSVSLPQVCAFCFLSVLSSSSCTGWSWRWWFSLDSFILLSHSLCFLCAHFLGILSLLFAFSFFRFFYCGIRNGSGLVPKMMAHPWAVIEFQPFDLWLLRASDFSSNRGEASTFNWF